MELFRLSLGIGQIPLGSSRHVTSRYVVRVMWRACRAVLSDNRDTSRHVSLHYVSTFPYAKVHELDSVTWRDMTSQVEFGLIRVQLTIVTAAMLGVYHVAAVKCRKRVYGMFENCCAWNYTQVEVHGLWITLA